MADDKSSDEVVLRPRLRRTELSDSVTLSDGTTHQERFKARNTTNLRANSYGSTQDVRPSSMTDVSSSPKSSNRLRDIGKSYTVETRALPSLRPLSASRPFSASMVNLSRTGSLDGHGYEHRRFSGTTYEPRAAKIDYPKTRQNNGSPFQVDVLKGIAGIGIKVKVTPKGYAQITDIQRGGPMDKNGQVRVGDNVLFVNTTELTGHTDARVQQVLRLLPRGLTKLVISTASSPEYEKNEDGDKFNAIHSQQFVEQPLRLSSNIIKEQVSYPADLNDVLHNQALSSDIVPDLITAKAVSRNSASTNVNSGAIETTVKYLDEISHLPHKLNSVQEVLPEEASHKHAISFNEIGEVYNGYQNDLGQKGSSNHGITDMNVVRAQTEGADHENVIISGHTSECDTGVNVSGSPANTALHLAVSSKAITDRVASTELAFKGDTNTQDQRLAPSVFESDNTDRSTFSSVNFDQSTSDNIDESTLLSDSIGKTTLSSKHDGLSNSLTSPDKSNLPAHIINQSTTLSNNIDQAALSMAYSKQSTSSSNRTDQLPVLSNDICQHSKDVEANVTDKLFVSGNEILTNTSTINEETLDNIESPGGSVTTSNEDTLKLYRGVLVTLIDAENGDESTNTKPEQRLQADSENRQTTKKVVEPSATLDYRSASVSATSTETDDIIRHNTRVSEQPVPKKRTSLIHNDSTDKNKGINTSLIPLQERRRSKVDTVPPVPSSYPGTSSLYASRSLSVSTPALNPRKTSSLEPTHNNIENTNYQKKYVPSSPSKNTTVDWSPDGVSPSRISPMYASRSMSVSSPVLTPKKIVTLEHSPRDSESANHHNKGVLSPAPLNSALSPRRTSSSDALHASAFIYPTQHTHTQRDGLSGRLSGSKIKTTEHPHVYKTIQSQLYKAVHPDIYRSTSVTLLDKKLMSPDHESSILSQGYGLPRQPRGKSPTSANQIQLSSLNREVSNTGLENSPNRSDVAASFRVTVENPDDLLIWSADKHVSSSTTKDLGTTDNVLPTISETKRPVAPVRTLRQTKDQGIDTAAQIKEQKVSINTNIQKAEGAEIKEQRQENVSDFIVASDLLSHETVPGTVHISNILQEKLANSNEEFINRIHNKSAQATNIFRESENTVKYKNNNPDERDRPPQLSHNTSDGEVFKHSSNIIKTSTNPVSYSENSQQSIQEKQDELLQSQRVSKEDGLIPNLHTAQEEERTANTKIFQEDGSTKMQIAQEYEIATDMQIAYDQRTTNVQAVQDTNDIFTVDSFSDSLTATTTTENSATENETELITFENDIFADHNSRIVNDVVEKLMSDYSLLDSIDKVIRANHVTPDTSECEPPPLPDTPPPLPNAPPPVYILGGNTTAHHWEEQNEFCFIQNKSIENKVETHDNNTGSVIPQNKTEEYNAGEQLGASIHTGELSAADISHITGTNESPLRNTISNDSHDLPVSNADIDHAKEDIRVNSPSSIDMLSEDSGMPADEDHEMATDDTTSTPGELADNTFGLDSLKHVPCLSDIEAGLFPAHSDSSTLLSISVQEMDSEKSLDINSFELSVQSMQAFDVSNAHSISNSLPPPILPSTTMPTAGISWIPKEQLTQNPTSLQETGTDMYAPENTLLETQYSHDEKPTTGLSTQQNTIHAADLSRVEKQEIMPSTGVDEAIPSSIPALSDNNVFTHKTEVKNDTLLISFEDNVPTLPTSESLENVPETVISSRKLCLRSNAYPTPVLTSEAAVPVRPSYSEKSLLKSLAYDAFIRLVDKANAVLDAASAPQSLTIIIVHLHRDADSVPLGLELKHEGGILFRVSGIKNSSPVWKEGGARVGDWLLAVDSLWCDNVTTMRLLSRLAKPQHDSLLIFCRQNTSVDTTDSTVGQGVTMPSVQNKILADESHVNSVISHEHHVHADSSETAVTSPSKLTSLETKTTIDHQPQSNRNVLVLHQQAIHLTKHAQESTELAQLSTGQLLLSELEQSQSPSETARQLVNEALLQEQESSLPELASSTPAQPPSLPALGPPLQEQSLYLHGKESTFVGQNPSLQRHSLILPGEGISLQGQYPLLIGDTLSSPNIDYRPLISHETAMQDRNLSPLQQMPLTSQTSNQSSPRTDPLLETVQCEKISQVSKGTSEMQQESIHSPSTFQERSAKSVSRQQQTQSQNTTTLNEDVSIRPQSTRRLNAGRPQSELIVTRRREYTRTRSRNSLEEPLKDAQTNDAHRKEQFPSTTILSSTELTADAGPGVYRVIITKGAAGVGFCLEGGVGSPRGDLPITIKRIFKGGPAEKSGLLKVNDEILEVNGLKFSGMGHYEAWNHLKCIDDGEVSITIRRR